MKNNSESEMTNKRIDFDKKAVKRVKTMLPTYEEDIPSDEVENMTENDIFSYVVRRAIDCLYENDFKNKIEEI